VHVVWEDGRNGLKDIYYSRSIDAGASWPAADMRLDRDAPGATDSVDPAVCCSGSAVYVVWTDYRTFVFSQVYLNRSTDGGATWSATDLLLNQGTATCFSARPHIAGAGNLVCVVWSSLSCGGAGNPDIFCARSTDQGASWLPFDVQLDTNGLGTRASTEPRVSVDGSQVHVVWSDHRHSTQGRSDIYWNVPFGLLPYGTATPGSGSLAPRLVGSGSATLGSPVSIDASRGLGGAPGVLLIGGPGSRIAVPVLGGTLLVLPLISLPVALSGAGTFGLPFALPTSTVNVGAGVNFQALFIDPGAVGGVSMTNAVELWIG
jgi:hypothetical protein